MLERDVGVAQQLAVRLVRVAEQAAVLDRSDWISAIDPSWTLDCMRHRPNVANTLASIDDSSCARALRTKKLTCRGDLPRRRRTGALGMWLA